MNETPYPKQRVPKTSRSARSAYDVAVIGGGPAGLSAAIYVARFNRAVVVIDAGDGRSTAYQVNENYLGFPRGIAARDLRRKGAAQAARFGAQFIEGRVSRIRERSGEFTIRCGRRALHAKAIIIATGATDSFPDIPDVEQYVGRSLFWCITCDGWKTRGKRILVVGHDDEAATTALQFQNFHCDVAMLTNRARHSISRDKLTDLEDAGITVHRDLLASVEGRGAKMKAVVTASGERLPLDMLFSMQGSQPNGGLARMLRLKCSRKGFIYVDTEQRTSRARVYAAGDVTRPHSHQVVTAAHEGSMAAQAANYDLYPPHMRDG